MAERPIGVLGRGLDGLRLAMELRRAAPEEHILYFGARPGPDVIGTGLKKLVERESKLIVVADAAAERGRARAVCGDVPCVELLTPAVRSACAMSARGVIGVLAGERCMRSGYFGRAMRMVLPGARVLGACCPEQAWPDDAAAGWPENDWHRLLEPLLRENIDTLLLGSTHLGAFYGIINQICRYSLPVVDAVHACVQDVLAVLLTRGLRAGACAGGALRCSTDGDVQRFARGAWHYLRGGTMTGSQIEFSA